MVLFLLFLVIICFFQIKSLKKDVRKLEELMLKHFLKQLDEKKSTEQKEEADTPEALSELPIEIPPTQKLLFVLPETEDNNNPFKIYEETENNDEEEYK